MLHTNDGPSTQFAVVGHEDLVGLPICMGDPAHRSALVLSTGNAFKISATSLKTESDRNGAVQSLLLRLTQAIITQMAQTAASNRIHQLEQQLTSLPPACMN